MAPDADQLRDDFPASEARDAVVSIVRGYGLVQRLMGPYFARFDLTAPQFQLLTVANRLNKEPLTQKRLAAALYVSFPNVTVMLARLEEAGLVRRQSNPQDRREKFVRLTARGKRLLQRIWKVHQQQLEHVTQGLQPNERKQLVKLLNKLMAAHGSVPEAADLTSANNTSLISSVET